MARAGKYLEQDMILWMYRRPPFRLFVYPASVPVSAN
jgi:hypothetical protein